MNLTDQQKRICEQVINAFESGSAAGVYGAISIMDDGRTGCGKSPMAVRRQQNTETWRNCSKCT